MTQTPGGDSVWRWFCRFIRRQRQGEVDAARPMWQRVREAVKRRRIKSRIGRVNSMEFYGIVIITGWRHCLTAKRWAVWFLTFWGCLCQCEWLCETSGLVIGKSLPFCCPLFLSLHWIHGCDEACCFVNDTFDFLNFYFTVHFWLVHTGVRNDHNESYSFHYNAWSCTSPRPKKLQEHCDLLLCQGNRKQWQPTYTTCLDGPSFLSVHSRLSFSPPPPSSSHSFSTSLIQELANFLSLFFHFAVLCVYPSHGYVSVFLCESLFIILCPDLALS